MKKVIYFILSIFCIVYILSLSAGAMFPGLINMGWFGVTLHYFNIYGGVGIAFLLASVNFTGNIFKIILNILLILVTILYVIIASVPVVSDWFAGIFI